ncbi:MAG: hypothetical protein NVS9B15_21110 [Acidobacteriaceae bacterium]
MVSPAFLLIALLLPTGASQHGLALDRHLLLNLWIGLALLVLSHGLLLAGLIRRRRHSKDTIETRGLLWRAEFLPLIGLAVLFGLLALRAEKLWAGSRYTGANPAAMQVEVTGVQFAWYFRYPGPDAVFGVTKPALVAAGEGNPLGIDPADTHGLDDFVTNELVLPVGREVDLRLHAQDVIHGFFIPEMRLKQNAVPGETIHVHFTPIATGTYAILCTQLCGLGHYRMTASLRVLTEHDFAAWLDAQRKSQEAVQ